MAELDIPFIIRNAARCRLGLPYSKKPLVAYGKPCGRTLTAPVPPTLDAGLGFPTGPTKRREMEDEPPPGARNRKP